MMRLSLLELVAMLVAGIAMAGMIFGHDEPAAQGNCPLSAMQGE